MRAKQAPTEMQMSVLKTLKLSNAAPVAMASDPLHRARDKLLGSLADQRTYATAVAAGELYTPRAATTTGLGPSDLT